ncbi:MAG: hypothetical protein M0P59_10060 [Gallionella sp.]|jgi:hypothetical protein|nr:hypothetical protein [Gallionella sp.]MCK9354490.1 hypothetical protein [Gallionella sp.]
MNMPRLKNILILMGSIFAAGCTTPVPVVPHAIRCELSAELQAGNCSAPKPLPEDATFQTLVDTMLTDRQALRECGLTANALRDSINKCNQATDDFNKKIDELNKSNGRQ